MNPSFGVSDFGFRPRFPGVWGSDIRSPVYDSEEFRNDSGIQKPNPSGCRPETTDRTRLVTKMEGEGIEPSRLGFEDQPREPLAPHIRDRAGRRSGPSQVGAKQGDRLLLGQMQGFEFHGIA